MTIILVKEGITVNVKLEIRIYSQERKEGLIFNKTYRVAICPTIGEKIKDSIFDEHKRVVEVIHNLSQDLVTVVLESKEVPDINLNGHIQEVAALHKWVERIKDESTQ